MPSRCPTMSSQTLTLPPMTSQGAAPPQEPPVPWKMWQEMIFGKWSLANGILDESLRPTEIERKMVRWSQFGSHLDFLHLSGTFGSSQEFWNWWKPTSAEYAPRMSCQQTKEIILAPPLIRFPGSNPNKKSKAVDWPVVWLHCLQFPCQKTSLENPVRSQNFILGRKCAGNTNLNLGIAYSQHSRNKDSVKPNRFHGF